MRDHHLQIHSLPKGTLGQATGGINSEPFCTTTGTLYACSLPLYFADIFSFDLKHRKRKALASIHVTIIGKEMTQIT
ncbi:hypothetical protein CEXT_327881 [Caerostris extrusa]|uniref:Uncharacterized protein n=1 Tax=Caerostris extrusa TaxID=172846 RepID=A0AAV4VC35_CAEEX|nr:hypothetical protein CEXT_327881 [Caerostris extrusa]